MQLLKQRIVEFLPLVMMYPGGKSEPGYIFVKKLLSCSFGRLVLRGISLSESSEVICNQKHILVALAFV